MARASVSASVGGGTVGNTPRQGSMAGQDAGVSTVKRAQLIGGILFLVLVVLHAGKGE